MLHINRPNKLFPLCCSFALVISGFFVPFGGEPSDENSESVVKANKWRACRCTTGGGLHAGLGIGVERRRSDPLSTATRGFFRGRHDRSPQDLRVQPMVLS